MRYVTYDEAGNLTGCYLQALPLEHGKSFLQVSEDIAHSWVAYRMNAARTGLEQVPIRAPAQTVPTSVPMLDARLTLIAAGKMPAVKAYLNALPGAEGEQAREYFEYALSMKRDHPLVLAIPDEIMTEAEKDQLFIAAGELNA